MVKPNRSLAHQDMLVESWLMVLLKMMNLKSQKRECRHQQMNGQCNVANTYILLFHNKKEWNFQLTLKALCQVK
jgi:hypothetical protein